MNNYTISDLSIVINALKTEIRYHENLPRHPNDVGCNSDLRYISLVEKVLKKVEQDFNLLT